jgi:hypothetical protein
MTFINPGRWLRPALIAISMGCLVAGAAVAEQTIIFEETWESGIGNWSASNGAWQVGGPSGGCEAHGGTQVAATNLTGNYPRYTNSRLESPIIQLPADPADGQLWLRFWHWFNMYPEGDYSRVEISVEGGAWEVLGNSFYEYSGVWSPYILDLAPYAGQAVQLGFRMVDAIDYSPAESWGWYIDDITVAEGAFPWLSPETFDNDCHGPDYGGWYADQGGWQIGAPSHGIDSPRSGLFCAGTNLDGNYPRYMNSRLVSPLLEIPAAPLGGQVWLSFMHWYNFYPEGDYGRVDILIDGSWTTLSGVYNFDQYSPWTECLLDLSPYVGQTVRVGFYLYDAIDYSPAEAPGWFIDDVAVVEGPAIFNNPDSFEGGSRGWSPNNGVWQVGAPTHGPIGAHTGEHCWGTNLGGNYNRYTNSELQTSWVDIPAVPDGPVYLKVWEWHNFYPEGDYGVIRIRTADGAVADLSGHFTGSSDWTQFVSEDLAPTYAGQRVRFGFYMSDAVDYNPAEAPGWYLDDFEVTGLPQSTPETWPDVGVQFPSVTYSPDAPVINWMYLPFDPQYVAVYASRIEDFIPNLGNRIALLGDDPTTYLDEARPGWGYYYKVALIDDLWHESSPGPVTPPYVGAPDVGGGSGAGLANLRAAFPNPFNPSTSIRFELARDANVTLEVFDVAGRKVATLLHDEALGAGVHESFFAPRDLPSGLYLCRLKAGADVQTRKLMLTK